MKLYCVRHGQAESTALSDKQRALTEKGQADIEKIAAVLAQRHVAVAHVMHSEKQRAKQTAKILAQAVAPHQAMETCDLLTENGAVQPLAEQIRQWSDDTMLVGHMPFMSELVSELVVGSCSPSIVRFPPGTIVCLQNDEQHQWQLNWVLRPDLIADEPQ